jgi:cytosine/adenosine deaminase-related metal-dependent hydrolase
MRQRGISVSLGADGAPCNNNLDMFREMRLAALIQKVRLGPEVMSAREVFGMATRGGAIALGLEEEIGSIEPGKKADMILLDLCRAHSLPAEDPYSQIVYSAKSSDVHTTIVDGRILMRDRRLLTMDEDAIVQSVPSTLTRLLRRVPEEN